MRGGWSPAVFSRLACGRVGLLLPSRGMGKKSRRADQMRAVKIERHPTAPVSLRQIDPLIRELNQYRDLIDRMTQTQEA